ncbi:hypothetical protein DFQ27_000833, partial [Actinomortierella ambigua]
MNIAVQELLKTMSVNAEAAEDADETTQTEEFDVLYSGEQIDEAPSVDAASNGDILVRLRRGVNKI